MKIIFDRIKKTFIDRIRKIPISKIRKIFSSRIRSTFIDKIRRTFVYRIRRIPISRIEKIFRKIFIERIEKSLLVELENNKGTVNKDNKICYCRVSISVGLLFIKAVEKGIDTEIKIFKKEIIDIKSTFSTKNDRQFVRISDKLILGCSREFNSKILLKSISESEVTNCIIFSEISISETKKRSYK